MWYAREILITIGTHSRQCSSQLTSKYENKLLRIMALFVSTQIHPRESSQQTTLFVTARWSAQICTCYQRRNVVQNRPTEWLMVIMKRFAHLVECHNNIDVDVLRFLCLVEFVQVATAQLQRSYSNRSETTLTHLSV